MHQEKLTLTSFHLNLLITQAPNTLCSVEMVQVEEGPGTERRPEHGRHTESHCTGTSPVTLTDGPPDFLLVRYTYNQTGTDWVQLETRVWFRSLRWIWPYWLPQVWENQSSLRFTCAISPDSHNAAQSELIYHRAGTEPADKRSETTTDYI